eukprot:TRINITY_DN62379_c0_g1_i1.p1 TRINITY_DN62379_c0_g1~~TRINITY_DN62379_c0_g1_i1.p1  ORF type:complete len:181 (+),score=20.48 TRINITY_DN62379_c0_g1_i1:33-545(+)
MAAVVVAGGYHGPPPSRNKHEEEPQPGSLEWLLEEAEVSWRQPSASTGINAKPKVKIEDLDRIVRERMVEHFTERANLRTRVDVVHKGGMPDHEEACSAVGRAFWAGPLLSCAVGLSSVSRPVGACCSDTMEVCGCRPSDVRHRPRNPAAARAETGGSWWDTWLSGDKRN